MQADCGLDRAVGAVVTGRCDSGTKLARRLSIPRRRADGMMELLEWMGIVGKPAPDGRRPILLSEGDWEEVLSEGR